MVSLNEAVMAVLEDYRINRGLNKYQMGRILTGEASKSNAQRMWDTLSSQRNNAKKITGITVDKLEKFATFFGVNPETIIIEARLRREVMSRIQVNIEDDGKEEIEEFVEENDQ